MLTPDSVAAELAGWHARFFDSDDDAVHSSNDAVRSSNPAQASDDDARPTTDAVHASDTAHTTNTRPTTAPLTAHRLSDFRELVLEHGEGALFKGTHPRHITASLFVLSTDLSQILLAEHKKAKMWLQFGGHLERADASLADAALREGREESGLAEFVHVLPEPCDFDIHELGGGFGAICREHWDVGFVALADADAPVVVSSESENVRWFPVADLPDGGAGGMAERVQSALARAKAGLEN
ncbi:NUDIX hydrolase [Trueperella bialowiezensis]|uniref:NUDIX domain n=1 Tax=Trueperella bialowiezensis TaxID=312285 RepID=A0A3S4YXX7_9ACTO|nr:NUDIX domain-containing protein [Trueperella bialowiezensis]VEI13271.1 NUDIX domain [Trueperella bialowiezensis]